MNVYISTMAFLRTCSPTLEILGYAENVSYFTTTIATIGKHVCYFSNDKNPRESVETLKLTESRLTFYLPPEHTKRELVAYTWYLLNGINYDNSPRQIFTQPKLHIQPARLLSKILKRPNKSDQRDERVIFVNKVFN